MADRIVVWKVNTGADADDEHLRHERNIALIHDRRGMTGCRGAVYLWGWRSGHDHFR